MALTAFEYHNTERRERKKKRNLGIEGKNRPKETNFENLNKKTK